MDYAKITADVKQAVEELVEKANLQPGQILVVGCSTSEAAGKRMGTSSSLEIADAILAGLLPFCRKAGLYLAVQCCEHLNRALVVEKACQEKYNLEEVSVYPVQGAGGSLAHRAMQNFTAPLVVERIQAHAGLDIGDTFIGMHLKPVVVPVRSSINKIGEAHLTLARTRPRLIGGERARYTPI
ncbi:MAG: TIGR01440 family protein [Clostridia bacterium]|jgi:uncharacterized protein (TIGR01440 family)|nr:TIGR01440 family protein [Clostridia bacterium]